MALHRKDITAVSNVQVPTGGEDAIRVLLQSVVQAAIEAEFERFVGVGRWERGAARRGWRNGSKPRQLKTRVGTLELRIPKDREGRFQPALFGRYQRSEQALVLALVEMYIAGVSTRKVSGIVEELCGFSISASQVSALTKKLDRELEAWRTRSLSEQTTPYLVLDAHYEKVRVDGHVRSVAVLRAMGVRESGHREHLGVWTGAAESAATWQTVCQDLLERGVRGVRLIVSDEHAGLRQALQRAFPEAAHQRCQVHYLRNLFGQTTPERFQAIRDGLREVWDSATREAALARVRALIDQVEVISPRAARWIEESIEETLAVFELPTALERQRLRSTNGLEHDHAEIRRRTRVIRIFPNENSLIRLASALSIERNEQWARTRYLLVSEAARTERRWQKIKRAS
jgi:transposase-like protein